ncbi:MAG TPA: hypothetical protein VH988_19905 [Thermoanaerobaculia bacterium]|jgi:hypothetical protein|nr:hypothetical protein [Thermoanaerobaculia bacterium]
MPGDDAANATDDGGPRILRILLTARDKEALAALLRENPLDLSCGGPRRRADGLITVEAFVPEGDLDRLRRYSVQVDVIEDASAKGRERQKEVGQGNRFEGKITPRGLGRKIKDDGHELP